MSSMKYLARVVCVVKGIYDAYVCPKSIVRDFIYSYKIVYFMEFFVVNTVTIDIHQTLTSFIRNKFQELYLFYSFYCTVINWLDTFVKQES